MTDHVAQLAQTLNYDPYVITADNDKIQHLSEPLDRIARTIDQMSGDLGMSGIGADAASESLAQLAIDVRGHADTVGQFAAIANKALGAVGTAYDGYFDLPAGQLTNAQQQNYVQNNAGTAIPYIEQEMQQERQAAAAKVLTTLDADLQTQIQALAQAGLHDREPTSSTPDGAPGAGGASVPTSSGPTLSHLPTSTSGGTTGTGTSTSSGGGQTSSGIVGSTSGVHGGTASGGGGGPVTVDGPTTGTVPGLGAGGSSLPGIGSGAAGGASGGGAGGLAGGLAGALTVGGGALGSRLSGALGASGALTGSGGAPTSAVLGGSRATPGTALSGGARGGAAGARAAGGLGSGLRAGGSGLGESGEAGAGRSGGALLGSTGTGASGAEGGAGAAGARGGTAISGMPGGGAGGSSKSRRRAGSLGYLAPELDEDDEPCFRSAPTAGAGAGTRETPVEVTTAPADDDRW
jgi:hypothetical protein